jgi:hypothetical protein
MGQGFFLKFLANLSSCSGFLIVLKISFIKFKNKTMNSTTGSSYKPTIKKFDSITLTGIGLILVNKKQETNPISFSEIKKIYIKKHKLSFLNKLVIGAFLLSLLFTTVLYLPFEIVLISLPLYTPILVWMKNFKSYKLHLLDQSNSFYSKRFNWINKQEHINLVNSIGKGIFDNQVNSPKTLKVVVKPESADIQDYSFQSLSIV